MSGENWGRGLHSPVGSDQGTQASKARGAAVLPPSAKKSAWDRGCDSGSGRDTIDLDGSERASSTPRQSRDRQGSCRRPPATPPSVAPQTFEAPEGMIRSACPSPAASAHSVTTRGHSMLSHPPISPRSHRFALELENGTAAALQTPKGVPSSPNTTMYQRMGSSASGAQLHTGCGLTSPYGGRAAHSLSVVSVSSAATTPQHQHLREVRERTPSQSHCPSSRVGTPRAPASPMTFRGSVLEASFFPLNRPVLAEGTPRACSQRSPGTQTFNIQTLPHVDNESTPVAESLSMRDSRPSMRCMSVSTSPKSSRHVDDSLFMSEGRGAPGVGRHDEDDKAVSLQTLDDSLSDSDSDTHNSDDEMPMSEMSEPLSCDDTRAPRGSDVSTDESDDGDSESETSSQGSGDASGERDDDATVQQATYPHPPPPQVGLQKAIAGASGTWVRGGYPPGGQYSQTPSPSQESGEHAGSQPGREAPVYPTVPVNVPSAPPADAFGPGWPRGAVVQGGFISGQPVYPPHVYDYSPVVPSYSPATPPPVSVSPSTSPRPYMQNPRHRLPGDVAVASAQAGSSDQSCEYPRPVPPDGMQEAPPGWDAAGNPSYPVMWVPCYVPRDLARWRSSEERAYMLHQTMQMGM